MAWADLSEPSCAWPAEIERSSAVHLNKWRKQLSALQLRVGALADPSACADKARDMGSFAHFWQMPPLLRPRRLTSASTLAPSLHPWRRLASWLLAMSLRRKGQGMTSQAL